MRTERKGRTTERRNDGASWGCPIRISARKLVRASSMTYLDCSCSASRRSSIRFFTDFAGTAVLTRLLVLSLLR